MNFAGDSISLMKIQWLKPVNCDVPLGSVSDIVQ